MRLKWSSGFCPADVCLSVRPPEPVASSLHSSRVLAGTLGGSITHQCFYTPSPANQHQRKYWCKITEKGLCSTIISSSFTSSQHQGRVALWDVPQNGTITVTMTGLRSSDSGTYRCGIGSTNRGLHASLTLAVLAGRALSGLLENNSYLICFSCVLLLWNVFGDCSIFNASVSCKLFCLIGQSVPNCAVTLSRARSFHNYLFSIL
uniref:Ig-like domain-containing protein n=1 Tax=Zonotrichia albicollis TaxID=44394 RepID=A0A8D2ML59_ZONAL